MLPAVHRPGTGVVPGKEQTAYLMKKEHDPLRVYLLKSPDAPYAKQKELDAQITPQSIKSQSPGMGKRPYDC